MPAMYRWRLARDPHLQGHGDTHPLGADIEILCPSCKTWKAPLARSREEAPLRSTAFEQRLTGACSDKCWDDYLGGVA